MSNTEKQKSVIYTRVTCPHLFAEGDNTHASQERLCRAYAQAKSYDVAETFRDYVYGNPLHRIGVTVLLTFLKKHRKKKYRVLIADSNNLAHDTDSFLELHQEILDAGSLLEVAERMPLSLKTRRNVQRLPEMEREQ